MTSFARLGETAAQPSLSISNIGATDHGYILKAMGEWYVSALLISAESKELAGFAYPFGRTSCFRGCLQTAWSSSLWELGLARCFAHIDGGTVLLFLLIFISQPLSDLIGKRYNCTARFLPPIPPTPPHTPYLHQGEKNHLVFVPKEDKTSYVSSHKLSHCFSADVNAAPSPLVG